MSYSSDSEVEFNGGRNGLTSDAFVRHIRRTVLTQGIQDDDRRIAQTAASSLGGEAMAWYEDQSEEIQESWKLLRRAILVRWPISSGESTSSGSVAPAPAAAAPATIPTPAAAPPAPALPTQTIIARTATSAGPVVLYKANVILDWTPSPANVTEVSVRKGDVVEVTDNTGYMHMVTKADGKRGLVPLSERW